MPNTVPGFRLAIFYFWYFAFLGAYAPFWPLYLESVGLSASQIGILLALVPVTRMIGPAFWGWLAENLWNIARYMADARAHELPLVGGGEHDWTEIFSRWGVLAHDTGVAGFTRTIGWVLMIVALVWLVRRRIADRQYE